MPRLFEDNEIVHVNYSTRVANVVALAKVLKYENKKYVVQTLVPRDMFNGDLILKCNTYELNKTNMAAVESSMISILKSKVSGSLSRKQKDGEWRETTYYYRGVTSTSTLIYSQFALQRFYDKAWSRTYPQIQLIERNEYVR